MRVFAGPNGSGKSTIFQQISQSFDIGYYINPDEIEQELKLHGRLRLESYGLADLHPGAFPAFTANHSILRKAAEEGYPVQLQYEESSKSVRHTGSGVHSYEAAFLADFLRMQLIEKGRKLTFETVMSHNSKLDIFDFARQRGYKVYLYFICTESPEINIGRVRLRVQQGGHDVMNEKIAARYQRTLQLLKPAVQKTYRSFLWDNSGKESELILEIINGKEVNPQSRHLPLWVDKYLLQ